jgi:hypothetical protein
MEAETASETFEYSSILTQLVAWEDCTAFSSRESYKSWLNCCVGHGLRLCFRTATSSGPYIHPQMIFEHIEPWWNDTDWGIPNTSEKTWTSATISTTNPTCTDRARTQASRLVTFLDKCKYCLEFKCWTRGKLWRHSIETKGRARQYIRAEIGLAGSRDIGWGGSYTLDVLSFLSHLQQNLRFLHSRPTLLYRYSLFLSKRLKYGFDRNRRCSHTDSVGI